jgi:hypothetical protein
MNLDLSLEDQKNFLELLEIIDVPASLPENGENLLSDLLDIADCIIVNLDCIDADVP